MSKIKQIKAREILASGGSPSLEVDVTLENGTIGSASVSYGASAGSKEAFVLLDGDKSRYNGKGMLKAVQNVNEKISPLLVGKGVMDQRGLDKIMTEADGTLHLEFPAADSITTWRMTALASTQDGRLDICNNAAERATLVALGLPENIDMAKGAMKGLREIQAWYLSKKAAQHGTREGAPKGDSRE